VSIYAFVAVAVIPAGETFECTPRRVWDWDGPIWCTEGPRIRLAGIAARQIDGSRRSNQPCPNADAESSRNALATIIGRPVGFSPEGHVLVRGPIMR
jgi:hypothetical protein